MAQTFDKSFESPLCSWCPGDEGCLTCLLSCFLPCVQYGLNSARLPKGEAPCAGDCVMAGVAYCALAAVGPVLTCGAVPIGCQCIVQSATRTAIRRKYNLKEEPCNDCCVACWCPACALCQEHYQLTGPHNKITTAPYPVIGTSLETQFVPASQPGATPVGVPPPAVQQPPPGTYPPPAAYPPPGTYPVPVEGAPAYPPPGAYPPAAYPAQPAPPGGAYPAPPAAAAPMPPPIAPQ